MRRFLAQKVLSKVKPIYGDTFRWHLWDGPRDLSKPELVDKELKEKRMYYVKSGLSSLPTGLLSYIREHDIFTKCRIVGVSIGPARGETVYL